MGIFSFQSKEKLNTITINGYEINLDSGELIFKLSNCRIKQHIRNIKLNIMSIQELNRERQAYISLLFNQFKIDEYNFGVPRKDFSSTSSNSTRNRKR